MKLVTFSDLHAKHWQAAGVKTSDLFGMVAEKCKAHKPDLIVDAGDSELSPRAFFSDCEDKFERILGNHCHYGQPFVAKRFARMVNGVKIAGATLWTDMGPPETIEHTKQLLNRGMNDFRYMLGFTPNRWLEEHDADRRFLREADADIVITHHAPSFRSVHPRFRAREGTNSELFNYGFASASIARVTRDWRRKPKCWIHGHMHDASKYAEKGTAVLANPLGYPGERFDVSNWRDYEPLVVSL